jgi:PIN domain nuclease of toxin-antitoxin system
MGGPGNGARLRLLLDTHIWLWSLLAPPNLGPRARAEIEDPGNELWLSPISVWETLILVDKRRIALSGDPGVWIRNALRATPCREAPLNHEVALRSRSVELPHGDPADRFLAATALVYELTLITADHRLLDSALVPTLSNV